MNMKQPLPFNLYLIGNRHQSHHSSLAKVLQQAGEAGVRAFQFREKDLSLRSQYTLGKELVEIARCFSMTFIVNGRVDLCMALDADGVQLPLSGFPIHSARKLLGADRLIGLSCHSETDVLYAEQEKADFAVLGPVYDTPSKKQYGPALGLDAFTIIRKKTSMPLFAIGGIDGRRLSPVFQAGADGVALISAIISSKDVGESSRYLLNEINRLSA